MGDEVGEQLDGLAAPQRRLCAVDDEPGRAEHLQLDCWCGARFGLGDGDEWGGDAVDGDE